MQNIKTAVFLERENPLFFTFMKELSGLIERCRKDERRAQFELYRWWFNDLMRIASRYKKNEEDAVALVNLAFFKILTSLDKYNEKVPFEGWIKRIMLNTVIDEYRKEKKDQVMSLLEEGPAGIESHFEINLADQEFEMEDLERMLNGLDEQERLVFNLYEIDGYSHKEISVKLGVSERSSKRYLARAKTGLRDMVKNVFKSVSVLL